MLGTAEIIRLALTDRLKPIHYVSTLAVLGRLGPEMTEEESPIHRRAGWPMSSGSGYAEGYGASKWAGEVLLYDLHQSLGVPVNVFRCSMILPHTRYRGQLNVPDIFTRLLISLVQTGLAPGSFYERRNAEPAHYDGLPVDFISRSILAIAREPKGTGYATYHVSNSHWDDEISLDTFVDWILSAGYSLKRIPDYGRWYKEFARRLQGLEESKREHSSLPVLRQLRTPAPVGKKAKINAQRFRQKVQSFLGTDIPHLTEEFLHKCLSDLQALRLISPPGSSAQPQLERTEEDLTTQALRPSFAR